MCACWSWHTAKTVNQTERCRNWCEAAQPAKPGPSSSWWDSPRAYRGWLRVEQAMKSTCLKHEEVRRGDKKGPQKSSQLVETWTVPVCQTAVHDTTNSRGGCGAFEGAAALIDAPPWHQRRVSAPSQPSRDSLQVEGESWRCKRRDGTMHPWVEGPKNRNPIKCSFGRQIWKLE